MEIQHRGKITTKVFPNFPSQKSNIKLKSTNFASIEKKNMKNKFEKQKFLCFHE